MGLSKLQFAVKDHGIGVSEEDRQRIFRVLSRWTVLR